MITRKGIEERIPSLEIYTTHRQATPLSKVKFNACTNGYAVCTRHLLRAFYFEYEDDARGYGHLGLELRA